MFTQKLSMDCTKEQYEKYLKAELEKMGYESADDFNSMPFNGILTGWNDDYIIQSYNKCGRENDSRTYLGKFNAPLFLALAAMTDKKYGGYGEWWYVMDDSSPRSFTRGKIYKGLSSIRSSNSLIDNFGDTNGYSLQENPLRCVRKATVSEIMAKFGEQPHNGEITFDIKSDIKELSEQIEKLAMGIQVNQYLIDIEENVHKLFKTNEMKKHTDKLIDELQQQAKKMLEALDELKAEKEVMNHKRPIRGELAIGWDKDKKEALIGICFNFDKGFGGDPDYANIIGGIGFKHAIKFESIEQYNTFTNE